MPTRHTTFQRISCAQTVFFAALSCILAATAEAKDSPRDRVNFDRGWSFHHGELDGNTFEQKRLDQTGWIPIDLPHDFGIEGPFEKSNPSGGPGGYLPGGIGWYRKSFELSKELSDECVSICFDGVYMNSEVWINGHSLGVRPYGYISFHYDLTPYLNPNGENVLEVRVDNAKQPSSRWYTGSGIYRHVWLTTTSKIHVAQWGTQIATPNITATAADVSIKTSVSNTGDSATSVEVKQKIVDDGGNVVASGTDTVMVGEGETKVVSQTIQLPTPELWSPQSPNLYVMKTELICDDSSKGTKRVADQYETTFGVREMRFDPNEGFFLNGESMLFLGVCNHDDLGPLGGALWDDALERRLWMLKEMGCNAIRTAHNPPPPELLEICDRIGFLVVNETFDKWRFGWGFEDGKLVCGRRSKQGYASYIDQWQEIDLTDHLMRDRNHPSVIMWSIGNELPEAQKHGELETVKRMSDLCHQLDPTRPVTVGCNFIAGANESGFAEMLDLVGYNGGGRSCYQYEADHEQYPNRFIYASEVPHTLQTRGEYRTHTRYREKQTQPPHLTPAEVFTETHGRYESSYDNAGVRISARDSWRLTKTLPFVAGEFRWTGFDYIGESGGWPRVLGNFGIIDLCNFPKDTYYFYQSQWTDEPMVHLLPHWTWPGKEGTTIPVWCYTNCDSVELFLNGQSLGTRGFTEENDMHMQWLVPYQPGELKAVATKNGKVVRTTVTHTAGDANSFSATPDRTELDANTRQLSYVTLRVLDAQGNFVPHAATKISLKIEGPGRLLATGNGDPMSHESFQSNVITTFNGLALAIVAETGDPGDIVLTATAEDMPTVQCQISVTAADPR
ncbi:glycoside hydrolase family 2 TIM barrel-domain containing protein [Rhodopirellula sallentina]|uniref:Glycosyl hydrolase family 2, sugar binding domain protein n=1 Tax=Rhodopirellula sallentina SM41 TaxID=1263870 RepID=M5U5C1_9BACT|nr:glycoside hydrolase family 2 TIM barrel-domain containing protein [Rhodopirellula sallentina]EMI56640.1 glycosyl hydrolase family 2, sugar binding domain protein [Rhodopirellula sallentina SM41]